MLLLLPVLALRRLQRGRGRGQVEVSMGACVCVWRRAGGRRRQKQR